MSQKQYPYRPEPTIDDDEKDYKKPLNKREKYIELSIKASSDFQNLFDSIKESQRFIRACIPAGAISKINPSQYYIDYTKFIKLWCFIRRPINEDDKYNENKRLYELYKIIVSDNIILRTRFQLINDLFINELNDNEINELYHYNFPL
jgi:hypothetical protein